MNINMTDLSSSTPIVIQFEPFAFEEDGSAINPTSSDLVKFRLKITPPIMPKLAGHNQVLPDPIVIPVPNDGLLKFRLKPSDNYVPAGKYLVEYFKSGFRQPVHKEYWIVPSLPLRARHSFIVGEEDYIVPNFVWEIYNLFPNSGYLASDSKIYWYEKPALGTEATFQYYPAVTLDQLIYKEAK